MAYQYPPPQYPPPTGQYPPQAAYGGPPQQLPYPDPYPQPHPYAQQQYPPPQQPYPPAQYSPPQVEPITSAPSTGAPPQGMELQMVRPQGQGQGQSEADVLHFAANWDTLVVRQKKRACCREFCCGCVSQSQFDIYAPSIGGKEKFLKAREHSNCCCRQWCVNHPFQMSISSPNDHELLRFHRPLHCRRGCCLCCCDCSPDCCFQIISVDAGTGTSKPGHRIGHVRENCYWCWPVLSVVDEHDKEQFKVKGDCCGHCGTYGMDIYPGHDDPYRKHSKKVGQIKKEWGGLFKEIFTDADTYHVQMPDYATGSQRALLLAGTILVDYLFFEHESDPNDK